MRLVPFATVVALHFPLLVAAHGDGGHYMNARQAPSASPSNPSSSASSNAPGAPSPTNPTAGASSIPPGAPATVGGSGTVQVSVSLISSNPTAVPLANITMSEASSATVPLPTTYAAGSKPTGISGAPPLPNLSSFSTSNYPAMDKTPPINSSLVQQWIQEVQNSGIPIPNITATTGGGSCAENPQAAADKSRCWWTCGGCTRSTDIATCPDQFTWGLTYDDGPGFYTPNLLNYLDQQNLKATFFTIGSRCLQLPHTLQTEFMSGHQIGVHTWSHPPLTTKTNEEIIAELGWTRKIIKDITGLTPNTFRPPYGDIDDRVRAIAAAMNLRPIIWTRAGGSTFDTGDFNINGGTISSSQVVQNWNNIMNNASTINSGFIVLEHDLFEQTVQIATGYILPEALAHQPKFTLEPVITCQKMSLSNSYVETNDNTTNPPLVNYTRNSNSSGSGSGSGNNSKKNDASSSSLPLALSAMIGLIAGASALF